MQLTTLRFSLLVLLAMIGAVAIALGAYRLGHSAGAKHAGSSDLMDANVITLVDLDVIAKGGSIHYQGSDEQFHFVRVPDVGFFRLRSSDVDVPLAGFTGDASSPLGMISLTLTIQDGKLKASDAPTGTFGIEI